MVRETAISIYLNIFRLLFFICKQFPQKKKTTFVASFGDNVLYTVNELERVTNQKIVILKIPTCKVPFKSKRNRIVICFELAHPFHYLRCIYHLATCEKVFVDNYFAFLAVTHFRKNVQCIQLWHAAGAIKQFGLKDLSIKNRSKRAYNRFKEVYHRFDHIVVGSENMAIIFQEGFGVTEQQILRTGVPRTDFFYNTEAKLAAKGRLENDLEVIRDKNVILYAPTYRDRELTVHTLALDIEKMYHKLRDNYVLLLSLHPAVEVDIDYQYDHFVHDVSCYHINDVLVVADILISDYSSVPFEYSLLHRPMIFFAYDVDQYAEERGFWEGYDRIVPGPIAETTEEVITIIQYHDFNMSSVIRFASAWNEYSLGESSQNLIQRLYQK